MLGVTSCDFYRKRKDDQRETQRKTKVSYFACFSESFPELAVASTIAGCDEVSDAAALQEDGGGDVRVCAEDLGEFNHLHQAETDHCCLGVVTEPKAITKTCSYSYNVLQEQ